MENCASTLFVPGFFHVECRGWGGGGGRSLPPLNFSPYTLAVEIKLYMMLDILLKNLSVENNWKNTSSFADIGISVQTLIEEFIGMAENYQL